MALTHSSTLHYTVMTGPLAAVEQRRGRVGRRGRARTKTTHPKGTTTSQTLSAMKAAMTTTRTPLPEGSTTRAPLGGTRERREALPTEAETAGAATERERRERTAQILTSSKTEMTMMMTMTMEVMRMAMSQQDRMMTSSSEL